MEPRAEIVDVDVVDNETGEIYFKDILLAAAHIMIARHRWRVVLDIIEDTDPANPGCNEIRRTRSR